jgi:hypothetical protein
MSLLCCEHAHLTLQNISTGLLTDSDGDEDTSLYIYDVMGCFIYHET